MNNNNPYTDTTTRKYQNSDYEKTEQGWVKRIKETEDQAAAQASPADTKKEYTDDELAEYAKKASDEALRKAGAGRDERMRIAAKKEILRRKNEGMPEPEKSDNPFDEGMEKGLFDELPTKKFGEKEYINKGQGWEPLEKARAAVGEIRTWSGEKYQKTATGWKYLGKDGSGGSKEAKEEKKAEPYDKAWPESLDKLTNRSHYDEIHDEAEKAAEAKFNERYPDEDVFFGELIEEDKKYSWRTPHYEDLNPEGQKEWKENKKKEWVAREASSIIRPSYRGPGLSKTAQIANIKGVWEGIKKRADKAKADTDYASYKETEEGKARRAAYGEAMKANADEFISKKNEIKDRVLNTIKNLWATGIMTDAQMDKMKVRLRGDGRMTISGISGRWDDVEVYYEKRWGDEGRVYKVQTSSYGSIEPGSDEAKVIALQAQALSNPTMIETFKSAIEEVDGAKKVMNIQAKELQAKYPDLRTDEVWDEYGPDDIDWD